MEIHSDFTKRAAVHASRMPWTPSPIPGVDRRMLDRIGGEVARATSIVRYAPGSRFAPHIHSGGEEFLVIDGVFQDEHGDFPPGVYVRNPPQSRHTPGSETGCTIFVKLWQFDPDDRIQVRLDSRGAAGSVVATRPEVAIKALHHDDREDVRIEAWPEDATVALLPQGGLEILCLEGSFTEAGETFTPQSWLRLPAGQPLQAIAGPLGCRLWVKEGHLRYAAAYLPQADYN